MNSPRVYNKKNRGHPQTAMYVGRPTYFGNPFTVEKWGREKALEKYREWIFLPEQEEVRRMARKVLRGRDLICWCSPLPCHAEILMEIAND